MTENVIKRIVVVNNNYNNIIIQSYFYKAISTWKVDF